jgi:hypothetical protein
MQAASRVQTILKTLIRAKNDSRFSAEVGAGLSGVGTFRIWGLDLTSVFQVVFHSFLFDTRVDPVYSELTPLTNRYTPS